MIQYIGTKRMKQEKQNLNNSDNKNDYPKNNNENNKNENNKNKMLSYALILVSVILIIVAFIVLPSRVTVNVSFSGEQTFMSKYTALLFPFFVTVVSSLIYSGYDRIFNMSGKNIEENIEDNIDNKYKKSKNGSKYVVFSVLGIILTLWVIFKNI